MGQSMVGRLAIKARQIQPGDAFAAAVPAGGLVEIVDLEGGQVAELVAFDQADPSEHLSLGVTRYESRSIMLSLGMKLYSSRGRAMLELVEDTVGRHDLLWAAPTGPSIDEPDSDESEVISDSNADSTRQEQDDTAVDGEDPEEATVAAMDGPTTAPAEEGPDTAAGDSSGVAVQPVTLNGATAPAVSTTDPALARSTARPAGFAAALTPFELTDLDAPDPVNFFMQLAVMQQGDLELRPPLSERGDRVVLQALTDLVVAVRCSAATDETNAEHPTDILMRVYR